MLVRICLLVLLAVAMTTGRASAATDDLQAELVELESEDAVLARVLEVEAPPASFVPPLVRATELEPPVRFLGRVFRPPRATRA